MLAMSYFQLTQQPPIGKKTSIFWEIEDELNILANGGQIMFFKIEDDLNILANGRCPQNFGKWKTTLSFGNWKMNLIIFPNWKTT